MWIKIAIYLGGALILHVTLSRISKKVMPKLKQNHFIWDEAMLKAVSLPASILIWAAAILASIKVFFPHHYALLPIRLGTIALILWTLLRFIKQWELDFVASQSDRYKKRDRTTVRAVCQLLRIFSVALALLIALQTSGISISAVLAFGGAGGIVVGLAAKDLLANFFGGLMIYLDRPFSIGDWIRSPDRSIEGTVEQIGWRSTRIRTFDRCPTYVPNSLFSTITIENPSRMSNRRIKTMIGVRYDDKDKVREITLSIEEMLKKHPEIDQRTNSYVTLHDFGDSALDIYFSTYTKSIDRKEYLRVREDLLLKVIEIIEGKGAEIAYPTRRMVQ